MRGLPSEVVLEPGDDPIPRLSSVNLDSIESVAVAVLVERLGRLSDERMRQVCEALEVAVDLATELAALPQTCMRHDRLSILEQWGLTEGEAMASELAHGLVSLEYDALVGAGRFAAGAGRHGAAASNGSPSRARTQAREQAPTRDKAPHQSDEKP
jgi:hypothetical protein